MKTPSTVLIAEYEAILRYTLKRTLDPEFKVVAAVGDGTAAVQAVEEHEPDIALRDISMKIAQTNPSVKVIMTTNHANPACVEEAFRRGPRGYVWKGLGSAAATSRVGRWMAEPHAA